MKFHAERDALTLELHERPFQSMRAPLRVSHMAVGTGEQGGERDHQQLCALCRHFGKPEPQSGVKHFISDLGPFVVKWERHTEFSSYNFQRSEPFESPFEETVLDLLPKDWLRNLFGEVMVAMHASGGGDRATDIDPNRLSRWFGGNEVFANTIDGLPADVYSDLRTHDDGFERLMIRTDGSLDPVLLGQLVQRVLEAMTYARLALLSLPIARANSTRLAKVERGLSDVARALASELSHGQEETQLEKLSTLSAELEDVVASSSFRYAASNAYYELVQNRLSDLNPGQIDGRIDLFGYLMRRVNPAMRTCQAFATRQEALSRRANRLSSLLQTGIEVRLEAQNGELLKSMNRRAEQAIRLQRTVEGLSVVAVSYYALSLIKILFDGLEKSGTLPISASVATAVLMPVVILGLWLSLRLVTRRVLRAEDSAGGGQ